MNDLIWLLEIMKWLCWYILLLCIPFLCLHLCRFCCGDSSLLVSGFFLYDLIKSHYRIIFLLLRFFEFI